MPRRKRVRVLCPCCQKHVDSRTRSRHLSRRLIRPVEALPNIEPPDIDRSSCQDESIIEVVSLGIHPLLRSQLRLHMSSLQQADWDNRVLTICTELLHIELHDTLDGYGCLPLSEVLMNIKQSPSVLYLIMMMMLLCSRHVISESLLEGLNWTTTTNFSRMHTLLTASFASSNVECDKTALLQRIAASQNCGTFSLPSSWKAARTLCGLTGKPSESSFGEKLVACRKCWKLYSMKEARLIQHCTFLKWPEHPHIDKRGPCGQSLWETAAKKKPQVFYMSLILGRHKFAVNWGLLAADDSAILFGVALGL